MSKKHIIEKLLSGESIKGHKESGNSMTPLIKHRQPFDLDPVDATKLERGDIVLVKVKGNIYTHKVSGVRDGQVQISNNKGRINGWTKLDNVYGIVTAVDGKEISSAKAKVKKVRGQEKRMIDVQEYVNDATVGLTLEEAVAEIEKVGWTARIVSLDGEALIVTMDVRTDRVNLVVVDNKITKAYIG